MERIISGELVISPDQFEKVDAMLLKFFTMGGLGGQRELSQMLQ